MNIEHPTSNVEHRTSKGVSWRHAAAVALFVVICGSQSARAEDHTIFGKPLAGYPITHADYELSYKSAHRCALWVAYRLTPEYSAGEPSYRQEILALFEDPVVAEKGLKRSSPEEILASGLWTVHVLSPRDALGRGIEAEKETYYLSNILLMDPSKDTMRLWSETENQARRWAAEFKEVWVMAGPIFSNPPNRIGTNSMSIPDAFYKIIIRKDDASGVKTVTYKIPQGSSGKLQNFVTTVDMLETNTGLDFLAGLPDDQEAAAESAKNSTLSLSPQEKSAGVAAVPADGVSPETQSGSASADEAFVSVPAGPVAVPDNEGDVWVLREKGVYYRPGSRMYGAGKGGSFMGEAEAQLLGFSAVRSGK